MKRLIPAAALFSAALPAATQAQEQDRMLPEAGIHI